MKNEFVKTRAGNHARLLVKRLLSSKSRNLSHDASLQRKGSRDTLGADSTGSKMGGVDYGHPQLLVAKSSQTTSAQPIHSTHEHSTSTSNFFSGKTTSPSTSVASSPTVNPKSNSSHVSGVAMGIAFGLIGLAILVICMVWAIRRRKSQGVTPIPQWKRDPFATAGTDSNRPESMFTPKHSSKKSEGYHRLVDEKALLAPAPTTEMSSIRTDAHSSFLAQSLVITPPGNTFNNPNRPVSVTRSPTSSMKQPELVKVLRAFLPTLPDELQIQQGETIEIINSFDDGWALCLNQHGEKGVVPLECLSRNANKEELDPQDGIRSQWRLSKRASSLYAGTSPGSY